MAAINKNNAAAAPAVVADGSKQHQQSVFHVVKAWEIDPERDVLLAVPADNAGGPNAKMGVCRIPVRSGRLVGADGQTLSHVQMVPGQTHIVQRTRGLRRLLLEFPRTYTPGIRIFQQDNNSNSNNNSDGYGTSSMTLPFAMFDARAGPTELEQLVQSQMDHLSMFLRQQMLRCERIRAQSQGGSGGKGGNHNNSNAALMMMDPEKERYAVEMMDMWVVKPAITGTDGVSRRSCFPKVVPPQSNSPAIFHTYFWAPNGQPLTLATVQGFQNFQVIPFVEIEDIFINKVMKTPQLKLRECIVFPPAERPNSRFSVCFPDRVCGEDDPVASAPVAVVAAAADAAAAATAEAPNQDNNDDDEENDNEGIASAAALLKRQRDNNDDDDQTSSAPGSPPAAKRHEA